MDNLRRIRMHGSDDSALGQYVEPVQLQVVCYQLWESIAERPLGPIEMADLEGGSDVDQALSNFYEDALKSVLAQPGVRVPERRLRAWFDTELITEAGTRGTIYQGEEKTGSTPNFVVRMLQERFLLRAELRGGGAWIELVHDRFVEPIQAANQRWQLGYENPLALATRAWIAAGRDATRLASGKDLTELDAYAELNSDDITDDEQSFLEESQRRIVRPSTWVAPDKGGTKTFGSVTIVVPAGFTEQSGANVIGDTVPALTTAGRATGIIPGSEFALGIYPNQDQTLFLQPFELRFVLDAAKVSPGDVGSYTIKMYRPGDGSWVELASQFDSSRYALVASVKQFAPVPKDFEFGWGWRTFFGIFKKGGSSAAAPAASSSSSTSATTAGDTKPRTNRGANLRSGPGTEYAVAGYMPAGTEVEMVGKTANGGWFKLSDDRWIAAFLVDNVPTLPTVITSVPHAPATPTATPTGNINNP